jgi:hypothetical protein
MTLPIAFALDGYPIYGLTEPNGSAAIGLDALNGHDKLMKGATVDVYYQVRYQDNNEFTLSSINLTNNAVLSTATQERDQLFQSAGLTFTLLPSEKWASYCGYIWHRDRLEANFLRTSARRYENSWLFLSSNESEYLTDAHTGFIGSSYQFTKKMFGSLDYSVTAIGGELGSGEIEAALARDNEMDNITQQVGVSLTYEINPHCSIGTRYAYAVYDDAVNSRLDSGYHTIGVLATLSF